MPRADPRSLAVRARKAARALQQASDSSRREAVDRLGRTLEDHAAEILEANHSDCRTARSGDPRQRLDLVLLDRLELSGSKLGLVARSTHSVADLPDPLGRTRRAVALDHGLKLFQVTVPLGVVLCALESRPDAVVQVSALTLRTGNALLIKGGREAAHSNAVLVELARAAAVDAGLPADAVQLVPGRQELTALLAHDDLIDLVIPRGSATFVRHVKDSTRIAVLGHAEGVCHTYVDRSADLEKALAVCLDAKLDYPAACNATECFLVHREVARAFVPRLVRALFEGGVKVHADVEARRLAPRTLRATPGDWGQEYGGLACALHIVGSLEEAVEFIDRHGSHHTEAILTQNPSAANRFVELVDSAGVFVNASTRFADGYRYGLGAEVGVSTGKLHARGPVGLDGLTSTKWILAGDGHTAGPYQGATARPFLHHPLDEAWHGL